MSVAIVLKIILLAALLFLSATFSGSETALFSLRRWRVHRLSSEGLKWAHVVKRFLEDPKLILITILVGNEMVNVASSNLAASLRRELWGGAGQVGIFIGIGVMTFLLLILGEITPKTIAINYPEQFSHRTASFLNLFSLVVRPVARALNSLTGLLTRKGPGGRALEHFTFTEEDFKALLKVGTKEGSLHPEELNIIRGVFRLNDAQVKEAMVPRTDMAAIPYDYPLTKALSFARKTKFSRIPCYRASLDDIVGILYVKDLLSLRYHLISPQSLSQLMKPAMFVPAHQRLLSLIRQMQQRQTTIAIVLDEYGGTAGLVTLEDLLEEMMGEIEDEFDVPTSYARKLGKNLYLFKAKTPLREFNRRMGVRLKARYTHTLAGYVLELMERVPRQGESAEDEAFVYRITKMSGPRILTITVKRKISEKEGG
ncbi:MAG: hemolysin family protein [Candidatus Aminicenantes bacterium]|nr:hemolysin family protein [Candidatus Aminicenantes bacterium]